MSTMSQAPHVLFAVAAGPRLGFGHLVRCGILASAMGVRPRVALRASGRTRRVARALGWHVCRPLSSTLRAIPIDVLIVDEPSASDGEKWVRRARRTGIPTVAIQDLGVGGAGADLTIDGTFVPSSSNHGHELRGPAFALLDPFISHFRQQRLNRHDRRVLIALGGGAYIRRLGVEIAAHVRALAPDTDVELAPGFTSGSRPTLPPGCRWIDPHALRHALATSTVSIVAGGITLFEALALGTPTVAVALNEGQHVTTRQAAAHGAALDAGLVADGLAARKVAARAVRLLSTPDQAAALALAGRELVDGQGTARVVQRIAALLHTTSRDRRRHAA